MMVFFLGRSQDVSDTWHTEASTGVITMGLRVVDNDFILCRKKLVYTMSKLDVQWRFHSPKRYGWTHPLLCKCFTFSSR